VTDHKMKPMDKSRKDDFLSISGSRMRKMAREGLQKCKGDKIPSGWEQSPTCVPQGFMVKSGWDIMIDYYQNVTALVGFHLRPSFPRRLLIRSANSSRLERLDVPTTNSTLRMMMASRFLPGTIFLCSPRNLYQLEKFSTLLWKFPRVLRTKWK